MDAVFDIETANWTEFVIGGVHYADGTYDAYDWKREEEFFDGLIAVRGPDDTVGNVWSHNGGRFDIKWALDWATKRGITCDAVGAGSNIICATIGRTRFLDSKALTKISLEELTKGASVAKQKLGLDCIGADRGCQEEPGECRGYCAISRDMPLAKQKRLAEYLRADCESLFIALQKLREYAHKFDLDLSMSVGSSAWKNAKRLLGLPPARLNYNDHKFARRGYYGGRVPCIIPHVSQGYELDVNSMYPSRLAYFPVPTGACVRLTGNDCKRALGNFPGIYRCEVRVPDMHIPPLPLRIGARIAYPTGDFSGTWTSVELLYALEKGCRVKKFEEALVWRGYEVLFKPWVDKMFDLRSKALGWDGKPDKKGPIGTFLKFYANSVTGKLGSNPETLKIHINPELANGEDECTCPTWWDKCKCGAWIPMDAQVDSALIWGEPQYRLQSCAHVEWAAFLTAEARVEWHKQAVSVDGGEDVAYGDTDSLFTKKKRTRNMGKGLGQWDEGDEFTNLEVFAPKVYRLDSHKEEGPRVKAKGLRLPQARPVDGEKPADFAKRRTRAARKAEELLRSGTAIGKDAVIGFRAGARAGKFFKVGNVARTVNVGYGDRILEPGKDVTRAPTIDEALKAWGPKK